MVVLVTRVDYSKENVLVNVPSRFNNYKTMMNLVLKSGITPCSFYDLAGIDDDTLKRIKNEKDGVGIFTSNSIIYTPKGTFITTREKNPLVKYADKYGSQEEPIFSYNSNPNVIEKFGIAEWAASEIERIADEDKDKFPSDKRILKIDTKLPANIESLLDKCPDEVREFLIKEHTRTSWDIDDYRQDPVVQFLFKDRIDDYRRLADHMFTENKDRSTRRVNVTRFTFQNLRDTSQCKKVFKPLVYERGTIGPFMTIYTSKKFLNTMPIGVLI